MTQEQGCFVWYDHMTRDTGAAVSFYSQVVGWGTEQWNGPMPYTMFTVDGSTIGGAMAMPDLGTGVPPHWIGYISTPDVDRTVEGVKRLGGTIHRPGTDIPDAGRFAIVADPQ